LIAISVDFIGLFDWHVRLSKSASPQSRTCLPAGREVAERGFLLIQSGLRPRRRETATCLREAASAKAGWIKNSLPAGRQAFGKKTEAS
jgi:hypothetical protein